MEKDSRIVSLIERYFPSRTCPCCEKVFIISNVKDYVYKVKSARGTTVYLCSWTCYRKSIKPKAVQIQPLKTRVKKKKKKST